MSREGMLGRLSLALYNLSNEGLREAQALVSLLGGENGPAWIAYLRRIRRDGLPNADTRAWEPSVLTLVDANIELGVDACNDPSALATREGVTVSSDFISRVLARAEKLVRPEGISLSSWELAKTIGGHEIMFAHGASGKFDESMLCACIDQRVGLQHRGEEGALHVDGTWNFFCLQYPVRYILCVTGIGDCEVSYRVYCEIHSSTCANQERALTR